MRAPRLAARCRSLHVLAPVDLLGREVIVRATEQPQVFRLAAAALTDGLAVIDLQPGPAAAANAMLIYPAAAEPIPFEHGAACGTRDLPPMFGRRCGR